MNLLQKQLLSTALSILGVAGVAGTSILAVKETNDINKKNIDISKMNKKEKFIHYLKSYKFSILSGLATAGSIIGGRGISYKTETSLIATAIALDSTYRKNKDAIMKKFGIDGKKLITEQIVKNETPARANNVTDGNKVYYDERIGYFIAKPEDIMKARDAMIKILYSNGDSYYGYDNFSGPRLHFTLKDFVDISKAKLLSKTVSDANLNYGWCFDYLNDQWEGMYADWSLDDIKDSDGNDITAITWLVEPVWNPEAWGDFYYGYISRKLYFDNFDGKAETKLNCYTPLYPNVDDERISDGYLDTEENDEEKYMKKGLSK